MTPTSMTVHGSVQGLILRSATMRDVDAIVSIVNGYAKEALMLFRTPESVALMLDDFVVVTDARGDVLGCGALKEYSPSLAEVASVAVARHARGGKIGAHLLDALERLARKRGVGDLFALTLAPTFFTSSGYSIADRAAFPEKIRRDCLRCPRRIRCDEVCVHKNVSAIRVGVAA